MGTMLLEAGVPLTRCFEALCLSEPTLIRSIHEQYVEAGAGVIGTNTFGANAVRLARFGLERRVAEINQSAAQLARGVANGRRVYVAGSVGPLGISADEAVDRAIDRGACYREQIAALLDGGVQLILLETFTRVEEITLAFEAAKDARAAAIVCSFASDASGCLACGTNVVDACAALQSAGAEIFALNCMSGADVLEVTGSVPNGGVAAAYPSAGRPRQERGQFVYEATPEQFAHVARRLIDQGVRLIGGCCGTTPNHVRAIADTIADFA